LEVTMNASLELPGDYRGARFSLGPDGLGVTIPDKI
jgi:hypothetical protein